AALGAIAEQVGKSRDELIREAVRQLVTEFRHNHRRELLRQARGMWKDRTDLPDLEALRREFDER
ncbi:MAG: CopG family transcriptional regulator, partial [Planctomycetes bacterium]|nr:CopG family transcriptional regulator [Planctomycetota bacterium]